MPRVRTRELFDPMTAPTALRRSRRSQPAPRCASAGGTLVGIFIGVVVGLGLAAGVAYWLMKNNPALQIARHADDSAASPAAPAAADSAAASGKPRFDFYKILPGVEDAKPQPDVPRTAATARTASPAATAAATSPGAPAATPAAVPAPASAPAPAARPQASASTVTASAAGPAAKPAAHSWLQAGSFTTEPDAENLKARLALAGLEASVQAGTLPDGSTRYRVRLGPYDNADELTRMKSELAKRGFDVAVIRF